MDRPHHEIGPVTWSWWPQNDLLFVDRALHAQIGEPESASDLTGAWFLDRLHGEDRQRHRTEIKRLFTNEPRFACASRIRDARGCAQWIHVEGQATRDASGRVIRVDGFAWLRSFTVRQVYGGGEAADLPIQMTDLLSAGVAALEGRETEQARRMVAEEAAFSQREFLLTVSHEIRNPLTVIFANISMLRAKAERERDGDLLQRLSTLERAGTHLRDIVSDVLDLAKAQAGHLQVEFNWFGLDTLLAEIKEMGVVLTQNTGVMFMLDASTRLGSMHGDRLKLKQILLNLLGNAVKFTKRGLITLRVTDERNSLVFAVKDTGPGIPPDKLDDLFKAFSQIGGSHAPRAEGTGLGLYISERYVRMLGGRLSVASRLGEGTVFDFSLPRVAVAEAEYVPPLQRPDRLVIGHTEDLSTLDPHRQMRSTNAMIARHHFEALTVMGADGTIGPCLSVRWEPMGDRGWRFHLRRGVFFHDGEAFNAEDVLATFERLTAGAASPYAAFLKPLERITAPNSRTIEMHTSVACPLLPVDMSQIAIVHRRFRSADADAFDGLQATIGTGPFRLKDRLGSRILQYEAFDDHWAGPPAWRELEFRLIDESGLASVSALLAGEVDLIDNVGPDQFVELSRRSDVALATCDSNRVWYLFFDQFRDQSPWITDRAGAPLQENPLKDVRVRRAISLAIDRSFITERLMAGQGLPLGDVAGPRVFGADPTLLPDPYDPQKARGLLAEAGYPDGFMITLHGSRDRSFHGATTLRAIALMLSAIGIVCRTEALPAAEFYPRAAKSEFSFALSGWGSVTGETSYTLRILLCTPDLVAGFGGANRGRYSNPEFDDLVRRAVETLDDDRRRALLMQASRIAMAEVAIAPICSRTTTWAAKRGIRYEAQADGATLASAAHRAPVTAG